MNIKVIYPGTFDPITNGHVDIIERASTVFSDVIIAVAENPGKKPLFEFEERVGLVNKAISHLSNIAVKGFDSLLVEFATSQGARVVLRGLRTSSDFEYEFQLAGMNRQLNSNIETVFLTPSENNLFISSSLVKEIGLLDGDISAFVPTVVVQAFSDKISH